MGYRTIKDELTMLRTSPAAVQWPIQLAGGPMFCIMTPALVAAIEQILKDAWRAQLLWQGLPGVAQYKYLSKTIVDEIQATNEIELVRSTRQEIVDALDQGDGKPDRRFSGVVKRYAALGGNHVEFPRTLDDLREAYEEVVAGDVDHSDAPDGKRFRAQGVSIASGTTIIHRGAKDEQEIARGLEVMLRQAEDPSIPEFIRAVAGHFIFEYVHPFYDGNGRTGRYLLSVALVQSVPQLVLPRVAVALAEHKDRYYRAFERVEDPRNAGDVTYFVSEILDILQAGGRAVIEELEKYRSSIEQVSTQINAVADSSGRDGEVLFVLAQAELFQDVEAVDLKELTVALERSPQTVRPLTRQLVSQGLVTEVTKKPLRFRLSAAGREAVGLGAASH